MRSINKKTKEILVADPFMKRCCLCNSMSRIQFHHNLIMAGRQSDIPETILPLCEDCHDQARNSEVKEELDWIMLTRMKPHDILLCSKAVNYTQRKKYLDGKFKTQSNISKSSL